MSILKGKKILLGVTGSIAAYKGCEIVRLLRKSGAEVQVMMTQAATQLVGPPTFAALSEKEVLTDLFPKTPKSGLEHIHLAETLDALIVAPATANIIAKIANSIADDLLSTTLLACDLPTLVAPAMNFRMWANEATKANVATLKKRGITIVEPEYGPLATLAVGEGRMAEPESIVSALRELLGTPQDFANMRILVTAGPTREPIDAVRFISNRSSGKMGYAVAHAALDRGANVSLVTGPTHLDPPTECKIVNVETAEEMNEAVRKLAPGQDVIVMAAAVADFKPSAQQKGKIKKQQSTPILELTLTPDILTGVRPLTNAFIVGFALEIREGKTNAMRKLKEKGVDAIVLNYANKPGAGFESDTNEGLLFFKEAEKMVLLPSELKIKMAHRILTHIVQAVRNKTRTQIS